MLKRLEIAGFKSFARKTVLDFGSTTTAIVGPNGSGKSNVAEAFRFALGEQSMKSMRGKRSEDLLFAGSHTASRQNRAAVVIVFDNTKRIFPKYEFDEITVERAVFRDGASEYAINGSKVRLRDVQELLASANIGETGHHIISQGEADRILLAHPRERRAMLEDALGLKVFEFKKQEAIKKLEKTEENVREVEAVRRELIPHLKFLSKQVEKLERAEELMKELSALAKLYFHVEDNFLQREEARLTSELTEAKGRLTEAERELKFFEEKNTTDAKGVELLDKVRRAEAELEKIRNERTSLLRELGRVEGALDSAKRRSEHAQESPYVKVPREAVGALKDEVVSQVEALGEESEPRALYSALVSMRSSITVFFEKFGKGNDDVMPDEEHSLIKLTEERETLQKRDAEFETRIEEGKSNVLKAREAQFAYEETGREERHRLLSLADTRAHEEGNVARLQGKLDELTLLKEECSRDKAEVAALVGRSALAPLEEAPQAEERKTQEERKRQLERLKIRVEEAGGTGEDVRSEFKETSAREAFLVSELEDLKKSAEGLRTLISDLDIELTKTFKEGLSKVNTSFGEFFSLMFGGGGAKLVLEDIVRDEEDEDEVQDQTQVQKPGIEISVNLPKKRVQSLMQLSGGERALTSIALIFAMSQVNPPPFLILDETDAALDEANSRRYGDMIDNLAKKSQLIVITHNRETMGRAGILYGVTMGNDGVSKLLSVKFEEAQMVAK
ncbi:MAG: AAA family ATPase [Candidatus Pacebacteria bacterium]|nr:AAA family ATPase [Candidatus Paceibacterota bacterium]